MAQKVTDVVGVSKESFAKAALNAVEEAAKTLHGIKWARITCFILHGIYGGCGLGRCDWRSWSIRFSDGIAAPICVQV